ncbi:MAG: hypothetical protein ACERIH_01695 [Labilibaculum antarcticum]
MTKRLFKAGLISSILLLVFQSCSDDELSLDGKLNVSFYNHSEGLEISIYT